jgi:thymidylate kinase
LANKYGAKKVIIDGIKFDSKMEADYFLYLKQQPNVIAFRLQPKFLLQDKFVKRGITFRKIEYKADFDVLYEGGRIETIDIKGAETEVFKIKRKLFEAKFPQELILLTFVKKHGGWITIEKLKEIRKVNKKSKK